MRWSCKFLTQLIVALLQVHLKAIFKWCFLTEGQRGSCLSLRSVCTTDTHFSQTLTKAQASQSIINLVLILSSSGYLVCVIQHGWTQSPVRLFKWCITCLKERFIKVRLLCISDLHSSKPSQEPPADQNYPKSIQRIQSSSVSLSSVCNHIFPWSQSPEDKSVHFITTSVHLALKLWTSAPNVYELFLSVDYSLF